MRNSRDSDQKWQREHFAEWLKLYGDRIRRMAQTFGGTRDMEDIFQEILLQLWRGLPSYKGQAKKTTWLYRVALNVALGYRRRQQKHAREVPVENIEESQSPGTAKDGRDRVWSVAILERFLSQLTGAEKALMIMYLDGLCHREIGEILHISANNVSVRIHRLKKRFEDFAGRGGSA